VSPLGLQFSTGRGSNGALRSRSPPGDVKPPHGGITAKILPAQLTLRPCDRRLLAGIRRPFPQQRITDNEQLVAKLRSVALESGKDSFHRPLRVSKVEQMEMELRKLSQAELRQIREWLDGLIEDELEFTPEFERSIQKAERDMAEGESARVREPEGS